MIVLDADSIMCGDTMLRMTEIMECRPQIGILQTPPTLLNELKRDHRWCPGNLQHLRLLFTKGIRGIHRALFVNGAMAYGSAFCWFLFLVASFFLEIIISTLLAPTRMLFRAKFVFFTLMGRKISWEAQEQGDVGTPWSAALRVHLGGTIFALCWGMSVFAINRSFFWWLSPILILLLIAIPLSVWFSRLNAGLFVQRRGLLMIPEETAPPGELQTAAKDGPEGPYRRRAALLKTNHAAFITAIVDPNIYTLHNAHD